MNHAGRKGRIAVLGALAALAVPAAANAAPVTGDFDSDGKADLAVDVEQENVSGQPGAGAVQVLYGSRRGPSGARDRIFTEDTPGVPQSAGNNDDFGSVLATGRFNR